MKMFQAAAALAAFALAASAQQPAVTVLHAAQFKKQMAARVPFTVGSDVGPFPHGT